MTEYVPDPNDGLPVMVVGEWAIEKHERLAKYVNASWATRQKYLGTGKAGATYIDPFCGPGRLVTRGTDKFIDGSALTAWKESARKNAPFSAVYIGDIDQDNVSACRKRLESAGAKVHDFTGTAEKTSKKIVAKLNRYGLHLAFLDPFNLETLHFSIIKQLSAIKRMDILVHISAMDLQRNLAQYKKKKNSGLDYFAPGWRDAIDGLPLKVEARGRIVEHWQALIKQLQMHPSAYLELVRGPKNQPLYWLTFLSRSDLAEHLWNEIRQRVKQHELDF